MTIELLPVLPPPPDPASDSKSAFMAKAEAFTRAQKLFADQINTDFVPGVNAAVNTVKELLPHLPAVHAAPGLAADAAASATASAASAASATASAQQAADKAARATSEVDRAQGIVSRITPEIESNIGVVSASASAISDVARNMGTVHAALSALPVLEALGPDNIGKIGAISAEIVDCANNIDEITAAPGHAASAIASALRAAESAASASAVAGLPVMAPVAAGRAIVVAPDGASWVLSDVSANLTARRARRAWLNQLLHLDI